VCECFEEIKITSVQAILKRTSVFPCHVRYFVVMMMMMMRRRRRKRRRRRRRRRRTTTTKTITMTKTR
jgi:hypothetical protein